VASSRTKYRQLAKRVVAGELTRVGKGVYVDPKKLEGLEGDFYRATLLCGRQSAICLLSALKYYDLSEQIFGGTWIFLPDSAYLPRKKVLRPVRTRRPHWKIGIIKKNQYKITNIERTLVDAFRYHRLVGIPTAVDALKAGLKDKKTTKSKIYEMAKKLGAAKKILPYLEAL
jgi:predicted transcriptional regulator of viral defense system